MERFGLDEVQAQAILDMRLKALQGLDREKLQAEFDELMGKIEYYNQLLNSNEMLRGVLKEELTEIRNKYGDDRKTEIGFAEDDIDIEDLIEEEECVFTLTAAGYIKRLPASTYRAQKRGGKGITAQSLKEEDYVKTLFTASTHDHIFFFTNRGRVHRKKGYQIPEAGRTAKGTNIVNVLPLEPEEKVTAMIQVSEFDDESYLVMVTRNGTVKRVTLPTIYTARKAGIRCITLEEGDELISVLHTDGQQNVLMATRNGMAICFKETDARPMGRDATGVRGIRLKGEDYVVGAEVALAGKTLLTVTENGYGKRTPVEEYLRGDAGEPQNRGGTGLKNYNITEKTGKIVGIAMVDESNDVMMISDDGVIIRMAVSDVNVYSRTTQGVILMRVDESVKVISLATTDHEEEEEESTETEEAVENQAE